MVPQVVGPLRLAGRVHADEARTARAHTQRRLKFTLPGPMTIVDTVADRFYGESRAPRDARIKLSFAADGLACTTAVHICYGYGIKANVDWKETLGGEWRQYEQVFPALPAARSTRSRSNASTRTSPPSSCGCSTART
jgi:5-methyltetrahydropteroyltriglutamate--homocysteine methyltransferase